MRGALDVCAARVVQGRSLLLTCSSLWVLCPTACVAGAVSHVSLLRDELIEGGFGADGRVRQGGGGGGGGGGNCVSMGYSNEYNLHCGCGAARACA